MTQRVADSPGGGASTLYAILAKAGGYRAAGLLLSGAINTIMVAFVVRNWGADAYAIVALLTTILVALPFADLGLGAAIVNATADMKSGQISDREFFEQYVVVRRILFLLGLCVSVGGVILTILGLWPAILGGLVDSTSDEATAGLLCIGVGLCLPLGLGARLLQGAGQMHVVTRIALINPIVQIGALFPLMLFVRQPVLFVLAPVVGYCVATYATDKVSRNVLSIPKIGLRSWTASMAPLRRDTVLTAVYFSIISIGLLAAFQLQRIILAHLSTGLVVAQFSLIAQYLVPVLSIVGVAAQALWPAYRRTPSADRLHLLHRNLAIFGVAGLVLGSVLAACLLVLSRYILVDDIPVDWVLLSGAVLYVLVMCVHQPSAMALTDSDGFRIQASLVVAMAVSTTILTVILIDTLGAAAPYVAIAIAVLVNQCVPTYCIARRKFSIGG